MKPFNYLVLLLFLCSASVVTSTNLNGRFVIVAVDSSKLSVLVQFNTNTGTDNLGGCTVVVGFDNNLLNISDIPQTNVDYNFHNFNGGNYSLGTVTKPKPNRIWINIDLPFNNSNNGTTIAQDPGWTDVVTINFDLVNSTDSISLSWITSSQFWGIYDDNNTALWNSGVFENYIGNINIDNIPPSLLDVVIQNPTTLELTFSEPLESSSAINTSNYFISNGITVQNALLNEYQDIVTLQTDNHTSGVTYTITAQNIYDMSGNIIGPNNFLEYTVVFDTTGPLLREVVVQNNRVITINFSERVDYNSASNKNNYSISSNVNINSVQLLPDSSSVKLNTSRQNNDTQYLLTVNNIRDKSGNTIFPNPSSKLYRVPKKGKGNSVRNTIQKAFSNSWYQYFTPEKTIDGQGMNFPDSRWQSGDVMPATITYDLGDYHSFDSLRIAFYKWESGRMFNYSVYTSRDSVVWDPVVEEIWSDNLEWTELKLDSTETRYVSLSLLKSNQGPFASIWEVEMYGTEITSTDTVDQLPETFELSQNYPNPFNPATKIKYSISQTSKVVIKVFDILGNEIATLIDDEKSIGTYELTWSAENLPSGVYFYQLRTGDFIQTRKMILLK